MGHPLAFEAATKVAAMMPEGLDRIFFTNSGSESVDTALKIALAYHRSRGEGQRTRLIGRERGYHGVGFGGISVGGIAPNRKTFSGALLPAVDHLPHTHEPRTQRVLEGPARMGRASRRRTRAHRHAARCVDDRCRDRRTGGRLDGRAVPPQGYLQKLREICTKHGILLIFDEVITAFGRARQGDGERVFRRDAGPDDDGQGDQQRRDPDGRGGRASHDPRHDRQSGAR